MSQCAVIAQAQNWLSIEIVRKHDGKVTYRNSLITNLEVNRDNVEQLAACGRARWKIKNESFNLMRWSPINGIGDHLC